MSKEILVIALGVWVAIIPYLGVPGSWRTGILLLSGIALIVLGFLLRTEVLSHVRGRGSARKNQQHLFVENGEEVDEHPQQHEHHGKQEKDRITSLN